MVPKSYGPKVLWSQIPLDPKSCGPKVKLSHSPIVPKSYGPKVPWSHQGGIKCCLLCHPGIRADYFARHCAIYQFILWLIFVPDRGMLILSKELCSCDRDVAPFFFWYDISLHFETMCIDSDKYFMWGLKISCHLGCQDASKNPTLGPMVLLSHIPIVP